MTVESVGTMVTNCDVMFNAIINPGLIGLIEMWSHLAQLSLTHFRYYLHNFTIHYICISFDWIVGPMIALNTIERLISQLFK